MATPPANSLGAIMDRDETGLRRQWALLTRLATRSVGLTLRDLAAEFAVTERTVRRDLETFRSVGFPIREEVGEFGRKAWRLAAARELPPLHFSYDEAVALYLGRRLLGPLAGTPFEQAAENAFRKIQATLTPMALDYPSTKRHPKSFESLKLENPLV